MLLTKVSIKNKDGYMRLCPEEHFTGANTSESGVFENFESQRSRCLSSRIDSPLGTSKHLSMQAHHKIIDVSLKPRWAHLG